MVLTHRMQASFRQVMLIAIAFNAGLLSGCAGPIAVDRAIWPEHRAEFDALQPASDGSLRQAWYAHTARMADIDPLEAETRDSTLSTIRNPFNARTDAAAVSRGAVIFEAWCQRCHGSDLRGNGPDMLAAHPTKDWHRFGARFAATLHGGAPRTWFKKIDEGYGDPAPYPTGETPAMPAFRGILAREQIWLVITYLQSLDIHHQPRPAEAPQ